MLRFAALAFGLSALLLAVTSDARAWVEGTDYMRLTPTQQTSVPAGKVEVMEVFSYACPACNAFQPVMAGLKHALPANVQFVFLPAAFNTSEDWPMFQRAYFAAQFLGVADRAHQGIFDAVWKTGELAVVDPDTHRLKSPAPTNDELIALVKDLVARETPH